ncbi:hypothetical protein [Micromonospora sp. WMMD1082]|uniref:hypothetical protein n=1 Tax=Micromonospora sp. WMMD1082 TaxID=3016104 RepID=UPI00241624F7|nr:hypothetical protein [Micromonospora sp. WMMD1082]MDG4795108.1 hypothetical protein [Micromonospora sp. WMMD1082]
MSAFSTVPSRPTPGALWLGGALGAAAGLAALLTGDWRWILAVGVAAIGFWLELRSVRFWRVHHDRAALNDELGTLVRDMATSVTYRSEDGSAVVLTPRRLGTWHLHRITDDELDRVRTAPEPVALRRHTLVVSTGRRTQITLSPHHTHAQIRDGGTVASPAPRLALFSPDTRGARSTDLPSVDDLRDTVRQLRTATPVQGATAP